MLGIEQSCFTAVIALPFSSPETENFLLNTELRILEELLFIFSVSSFVFS